VRGLEIRLKKGSRYENAVSVEYLPETRNSCGSGRTFRSVEERVLFKLNEFL
jgi:hypothetical protein